MKYRINQLAQISGVSVRALRLYDELGLLKPAGRAANGYRYYELPQLLALQQILLYRELGFGLRHIKSVIRKPAFDRTRALIAHRNDLQRNLERTRKLIQTIDKTIDYLKGDKTMNTQELFGGFSPEVQARHEQNLVERFGPKIQEHLATSKARVKKWTKADWERSQKCFEQIGQDLAKLIAEGIKPNASAVQQVVRRHYQWLTQFWTPNRESYKGFAQLVLDSDLRHPYAEFAPKVPEFLNEAIRAYADRELK